MLLGFILVELVLIVGVVYDGIVLGFEFEVEFWCGDDVLYYCWVVEVGIVMVVVVVG